MFGTKHKKVGRAQRATGNAGWNVTTDNVVFRTGLPHPAAYHNVVYDQNFIDDALESHTD